MSKQVSPGVPVPWQVLRHEPISKLEDNLWCVEGDLPRNLPMRRRMTLIKLKGGKLLVHNGIALQDGVMQDIEAWGEPAVLVVPNAWHRLDAPAYKQRYPKLRVYCPKAAHDAVQEWVQVDGHYEALPADEHVRVEPLAGIRSGEAVFVVKSPSGHVTMIFNDVLFNMPHVPGFRGLMLRALGSTGAPKVTPMSRLLSVNDKAALAHHLQQLAKEPGLSRLVMSHGNTIEQHASAVLTGVAKALTL